MEQFERFRFSVWTVSLGKGSVFHSSCKALEKAYRLTAQRSPKKKKIYIYIAPNKVSASAITLLLLLLLPDVSGVLRIEGFDWRPLLNFKMPFWNRVLVALETSCTSKARLPLHRHNLVNGGGLENAGVRAWRVSRGDGAVPSAGRNQKVGSLS